MATCLQTIEAGEVAELFPNTLTPFSINILTNKVFKFTAATPSQASFAFVFNPTQPVTTVSIAVTFFQKIGTVYTDIGAATLSDLVGAISKDFADGEYYVCIRSNQSYNSTVLGQFNGFTPQITFEPTFYEGSYGVATVNTYRPTIPCDSPLYFSLIEGDLPPGLQLTALGKIQGTLPNLDALPDASDYSPAQNWYYEDSSGISNPWGRVWRFKVRVSMAEDSEQYDEDWFCVRVHNDWTFDKENFLRNAPFANVQEVAIIEEPEAVIPETFCMEPCVDPIPAPFNPTPIGEEACPVCDESDVVTDIVLFAIPPKCQNISVHALPLWYTQNKDKTFDCKETTKFIKNLGKSEYFQELLNQSGYTETKADPRIVIEASAFRNFLQLSASMLVDGRKSDHLDAMMLAWRDQQNRKLPTSALAWEGVDFTVNLQ